MGFSELFTDVLVELQSMEIEQPVPSPQKSSNFQRTNSNINQLFKMINIWDEQIDNEIQSDKGAIITVRGTQQVIKCPAVFIEFVPNDGNQILGGVTQYMDAAMYFHIYSDELNSPSNNSQIGVQNSGEMLDMNLSIYDLRDKITTKFLGFHTHNSSAMMSRYDKLDYKHGTITKYLRGFHFCFNDDKGSIFDSKSSRYLVSGTMTNGTTSVTTKNNWVSGDDYEQLVSVVWFLGSVSPLVSAGYYLCTTTNNDTVFTVLNWTVLPLWGSGTSYSIGNYIYLAYFVYQCNTANSDIIFNPSNWDIICRI